MTQAEPQVKLRAITSRSRRKPAAGDMFLLQLIDGTSLSGPVILADRPRGSAPMPGSYLIYIYDDELQSLDSEVPVLAPDRLLLAPLWINRLPWSRGYLKHVRNEPLSNRTVLDRHCFRRSNGQYLDEQARDLDPTELPTDACGLWAMAGYGFLGELVWQASGRT